MRTEKESCYNEFYEDPDPLYQQICSYFHFAFYNLGIQRCYYSCWPSDCDQSSQLWLESRSEPEDRWQNRFQHCAGSPLRPPDFSRATRSDDFSRAESPVKSADFDYNKRAARRNVCFYCSMGFRARLSPANDIVARGDGENGTLKRALF